MYMHDLPDQINPQMDSVTKSTLLFIQTCCLQYAAHGCIGLTSQPDSQSGTTKLSTPLPEGGVSPYYQRSITTLDPKHMGCMIGAWYPQSVGMVLMQDMRS